jgi:hypothetical protein
VKLVFWQSTAMRHRSTVGGAMASVIYAFLVMISTAMAQDSAPAQPPSAEPETPLPSSITAVAGFGDNQRTSIQQGSVDQEATNPCSLRAPDDISQSPAMGEQASMTIGTLAYTPLSAHCKFTLFLKSTYSPYTFASAGFQATWAQAMGQWPHYGGGAQGWAKRFGATLADTESRRFIQTFALSTILHQDPRYFPSHKKTFIYRAWYAATRVVVTKNDNGDSAFNTSEFLGALFASSLENSYYPRHDRTFADTMNRFGGALSSDTMTDLLREFTPDIKRFFRRHAPKKIRRIEETLPIPPEDKP